MKTPSDKELHERARKRVEFRTHLIVYLVTIGAMWTVWFLLGGKYLWPIWPMALWGIGLIFHYLFEYLSTGFFSEEEEYRKMKKQMEQHDRLA